MFAKNKIIERIVRVDQAGEIGAQRIYNGQKLVFKILNNKKEYKIFSEMAREEKEHLDFFNNLEGNLLDTYKTLQQQTKHRKQLLHTDRVPEASRKQAGHSI